jgi:hypothetical protein
MQLTQPGELELSRQSLQGPGSEAVFGGVVLTATPLVAWLVTLAASPPLLDCLDFGSNPDEEQQRCEKNSDRQLEKARRKGMIVGLVMASVGIGVLAHGLAKVAHIRQARLHVQLSSATQAFAPAGATMSFSGSF